MIFKEFGDKRRPTIILLHGGGLSWWSFTEIIAFLKTEYYVVAPIIDGHGEDGATTFVSIRDSAQKLIRHIDANYQGKVLAICGVSLGAQIVVEVLSQRTDIAEFAVIQSALIVPHKGVTPLTVTACRLFYGLISRKWFARILAKVLCVKKDLFEQYYKDSQSISKESLIHFAVSNGSYTAPGALKSAKAKVLIIIGSKEIRRMDQSVRTLMSILPQSRVCIVPEMRHGELNLVHCKEYMALINRFMA